MNKEALDLLRWANDLEKGKVPSWSDEFGGWMVCPSLWGGKIPKVLSDDELYQLYLNTQSGKVIPLPNTCS